MRWIVALLVMLVPAVFHAEQPFTETDSAFVTVGADASGFGANVAARVRLFANPSVSQVDVWVGDDDPVSFLHTAGTARMMTCSAIYLSEERWLTLCRIHRNRLYSSWRELWRSFDEVRPRRLREFAFLGSGGLACGPKTLVLTGSRPEHRRVFGRDVRLLLLLELQEWSPTEIRRVGRAMESTGIHVPRLGNELFRVLQLDGSRILNLEVQPDAGDPPDALLNTLDLNQREGLGYWMDHVAARIP
jgi:hypothetical protein